MEQTYIGEHLLPGDLGILFIAMSFGFAFLAMIAYIFNTYKPGENSYRNIGRWSFYLHGFSIIGIIVTLFYLIYNHRFEYHYVWAHSSTELPVHFMISCFWEGQEGSFLLWAFWHLVLGLVLIKIAGKWEAPVMAVMAFAQLTLTSMLLGVDIFGITLGSNPFVLLRDVMDAPIFQFPNYVALIEDGTGLNPLLQNYWMVIHPPVLFIGFAASIIPFAYAVAGLWTRRYTEWVNPALGWTIFTVMILGLGILMGAAWAYEALNFGGYWAWDPVENASIIPWLLLISGMHTLLIYKKTKRALFISYILILVSFILVLYATFLTRSGILGETSVHSFTDLGLSGQLLFFIFSFIAIAGFFLVKHFKHIPFAEKEEHLYSREFWMFIGALVLILSSFQIFVTTSIPVFNAIMGTSIAPPIDVIGHYNKYQLPIAIVIMFLTGAVQYFKYIKTPAKIFLKKVLIAFGISLVLTVFMVWLSGLYQPMYILMMFAAIFAIAGNADILVPMVIKGKTKASAASIAHIGFAMMLMGALISSAKQEVISINIAGIDYGESFDEQSKRENIMLVKDKPMQMGKYVVTYRGDSVAEPNTFFKVEYKRYNINTLEKVEEFTLYPFAQVNPKMGLIASPDTRHYLTRDIYTHITSIPDKSSDDFNFRYKEGIQKNVRVGDTLKVQHDAVMHVKSIKRLDSGEIDANLIRIALDLDVQTRFQQYNVQPRYILDHGRVISPPADISDLGLRFTFTSLDTENSEFGLMVQEAENFIPDYIIMKAIKFPGINFLWTGGIIMFIGMIMAMVFRSREKKKA